ncbi:dipeptidyl aminopeptidase/acylaminoacyl peptidase [Tahibacter aquaticus]|uniref:Dipeptidyl aminopeptidase/acylaminoacyl peptidase n=1 Tax=Tahibacter aquaticus TaxID=520092 RepID=A0A4R6Z913_9GAMM|nr:S9 family peptidase [Tahibacter aquaticus]TDR48398.1 dipeptidyl aminopeptidase/acylaminoacyl peptidase [Tahibacter aquaticus]
MKLSASLSFALLAALALPAAADRGLSVNDLVNLERVSDPQLSPDGRYVAYQVRETDFAANKGVNGLWLLKLDGKSSPQRLTDAAASSAGPRWAPDGRSIYYTAAQDGVAQLWRVDVAPALAGGGKDADKSVMRDAFEAKPQPAVVSSGLPIDIGAFKLSPDGRKVLLALDVFTDCPDINCTKQRLDATAASKVSGQLYDKLFVRHWDTWADGRRSQLFLGEIGADGALQPRLKLMSRGIDGDVPSKPFGDDSEFAFSPDGKTVYFGARIAGKSEPWSTNFDLYAVPADASSAPRNLTAANPAWDANPLPSADGKTLYYLAMKRPGFEADRFGLMALDLASGNSREINPGWDRSAGSIKLSADGKTMFAVADDNGQHPLFGIDLASGKARLIAGDGHINGYDVAGTTLVFGRDTLQSPSQLFLGSSKGGKTRQLTGNNADKLKGIVFGEPEFFDFPGWNNERVQGYVVKPWNYEQGKKYPVAFLIHGGPQGAYGNDFHYRWNPQTYAGLGFAVVTVNFHGSTGYGQAFTDSISGDWGGKPLEDLQKGWAAALAKYSFLDGERACALGASYGGYMINWIAGNWQQPWKCLVNHDGVFDTRMMGYSTEELWFSEWENGGTPYDKPENYEKFNPVNHVAKWKVPMLVIQGGIDFRIPLEQSLGAFTALQRRGIDSQLLHFPNENHWVLKPQNSVKWHETVNAWLQRWTAK